MCVVKIDSDNVSVYLIEFNLMFLKLHPQTFDNFFDIFKDLLKRISWFKKTLKLKCSCLKIFACVFLLRTRSIFSKFINAALPYTNRQLLIPATACTSFNKPGPAQIGAISKAQEEQMNFKLSKYFLLKHPKFFLQKASQ